MNDKQVIVVGALARRPEPRSTRPILHDKPCRNVRVCDNR